MGLLFLLLATSVAASEMFLDSLASGYRWEDDWEYVTQTGVQTGNNELQDYVPGQVRPDEWGLSLVLQQAGERYISGKIWSKRSWQELAPNGGAFELQFDLPKNVFATSEGTWASDLAPGLWPAVWILPRGVPWPTGGEIDLVEMMHRSGHPDTAASGSATLHFGPRVGVDAVYDGNWGMPLAHFAWREGAQSVYFSWQRTPAGSWTLRQWVNSVLVWEQTTDNTDRFLDFEKGKNFGNARREDFAQGAPGDPAGVFQRTFDSRGLYVNVNLAFGGTPFGYDRDVDRALRTSVFRIHRVCVWADPPYEGPTARLLTTAKPGETNALLIGLGILVFLAIPPVLWNLASGHNEYIELDASE